MVAPTLEELLDLPPQALVLELAQLAEHGDEQVANEAVQLLDDRNADITPQVVYDLWQRHEQSRSVTHGLTW